MVSQSYFCSSFFHRSSNIFFSTDPDDVANFILRTKTNKQKKEREYAKISIVLMREDDIDDSICCGFFSLNLHFSVAFILHVIYNEP